MPVPNPISSDLPRYEWPPFPAPPPGKIIISFSDFDEREGAIRVYNANDSVEVDGMGVETVPMSKIHSTDRCKSNRKPLPSMVEAKSSSDNKAAGTGSNVSGSRQDFLESWWGLTGKKADHIDSKCTREEKIKLMADEFLRPWPKGTAITHNSAPWLWDQFRLFAGLLHEAPTFRKENAPDAEAMDEEEIFEDEDEDDNAHPRVANESTMQDETDQPINDMNAPKAPYHSTTIITSKDDISSFQDQATSRTMTLLEGFSSDIPGKVQTFLSGYIQDRNMNIHKPNLTTFPKLVKYFLMYIRNSRVLTGPATEKALKKGIEICDLAYRELPITKDLAMSLPDNLSREIKLILGSQLPDIQWGFPSELSEAKVEEVSDSQLNHEQMSDGKSGWGDTTSTWGGGVTSDWDTVDSIAVDVDISAQWEPPVTKSLIGNLGPTTLPLSFTTGIVERSVRRIKAIYKPGQELLDGGLLGVEQELQKRLGRVVLTPWPGWMDSTPIESDSTVPYIQPEILSTSKGSVTFSHVGTSSMDVDNQAGHMPLTADIILLIDPDPSTMNLFESALGLGLGAVWIQLVEESTDGQCGGRFWYMEDLVHILPSFYSEKGMKKI